MRVGWPVRVVAGVVKSCKRFMAFGGGKCINESAHKTVETKALVCCILALIYNFANAINQKTCSLNIEYLFGSQKMVSEIKNIYLYDSQYEGTEYSFVFIMYKLCWSFFQHRIAISIGR